MARGELGSHVNGPIDMTDREKVAEAKEQGEAWYKALTEDQRADRADQWADARDVLELERKKSIKPVWADPTARKYV
jgi:hypothetical protein